jgi:TPR repeat protein
MAAPFNTTLGAALSAWMAAPASSQPGLAHAELEGDCATPASRTRAAACTALAVMHETGDGAPRDARKAATLFELSDAPDGFELGGCHLAAPSQVTGISWSSTSCCRLAKECPAGCGASCAGALASLRASTVEVLERGCVEGRAAACFLLAELHAYGEYIDHLGYLVEQSAERAEQLYAVACDAGVGRACGGLALYLQYHEDPDPNAAEALYRRGCDLGAGPACIDLARLLEARTADPSQPDRSGLPLAPEALSAYERACALGMRAICRDLGSMYQSGERVPVDPAKAATFARLAG